MRGLSRRSCGERERGECQGESGPDAEVQPPDAVCCRRIEKNRVYGSSSVRISVHQSHILPDAVCCRLDVPTWVKNNVGDVEKQKAGQVSGLKIAGSGPGGRQEDGVGIVMSMDKDEATRRQERDAEAAAKRQQNALPAWHLKSTITGDLTALGMQESARAVAREGEGLPVSSDDSLKGLGTIGTLPRLLQLTAVTEDVKPQINQEMDCTSFVI